MVMTKTPVIYTGLTSTKRPKRLETMFSAPRNGATAGQPLDEPHEQGVDRFSAFSTEYVISP